MDISSLLSPSDESPNARMSTPPRARSRPPLSNSTSNSSTSITSAGASGTPVSYRPSPPRSITNVPSLAAAAEAVDEAMADAGTTPTPLDADVEPLGEEDYKELERLLQTVAEKPYQYTAHVQCIDLLRRAFLSAKGERQTLLIELRRAREELVHQFPMKECMWLEWIADERGEAKGYDGRLTVMELCGRAVVDQVASTKLWREYAHFVEEQARDANTKSAAELEMNDEQMATFRELFHLDVLVDIYRQGSEATSIDIADSKCLWDRYRDLLVEELEKDPTPENISRVFRLYENRLAVPHANIADTFSAFSSFVTRYDNANYEPIMIKYNKIYSAAAAKWAEREVSELQLKREVDAHRDPTADEWAIWSEYLNWETKQPKKKLDTQMACSLYERCLLRFGELASVWEDYVFFVLEKMNGMSGPEDPKVISLLRRATRSCPWSGTLWAQYIIALERGGKPFELVSQVKHEATRTGLLDLGGTEEIVRVNIAWCGFLKRLAFAAGAEEEAYDMAEMGIREATSEMSADPDKKDPHYRIPRVQINFYTRAKKLEAARRIWKDLAASFAHSYEFWLRYYEWELANGTVESAGLVIKHAVNTKNMDWPEKILETWRTHVEDYGNVDEVEMMMVKYYRISRIIAEKRQAEAAALAAQQQQQQEELRQQVEASLSPSSPAKGKRRRSETEIGLEDSQRAKKPKQEDEVKQELPATSIPDVGPPTAAQLAKRDRENCTVIVKNLPPGYSETKVRQLFRDCGKINSLKVIEENNGLSSTATVEFDSKEDTLAAQTKDQKVIEEHTIEVQIGTGSTLYVTNFPPIADDAYIRNLFQKFGNIVDIRFPSLKYNTHRRFCYVQFASSAEAQAATSLHGTPLGQKETLIALISAPNQKKERSGATQEGREIYIRNIDFNASEQDVHGIFSKYGQIEKIRLPPGPRKGTHKGFGFIVFSEKAAADAACAESGTLLKSRPLEVSIASPNPASAAKNRPGNAVDVVAGSSSARSMSPAVAAAAGSPNPTATNGATPPPPSFDQIQKKTLGIMNLPDTVNDLRLHALFSPFGALRKVTLRPDHQGAIVEFEHVADAGKATLKLDGHELDGRRIRIGSYEDLMKCAPEKKPKKGEFKTKKQLQQEKEAEQAAWGPKEVGKGVLMVPASVRDVGAARGRAQKRRGGLGFRGALVRKKEDTETQGEGDVDMKDAAGSSGQPEKKEVKKSNADFKKMFLKGSSSS